LAAGAADCSGWTSFGAAAQAEKIARVERETIETQLKIRDLFKLVLLLIDFRISRERRNANPSSCLLHRSEKPHDYSPETRFH
jgi:hypothetical protein